MFKRYWRANGVHDELRLRKMYEEHLARERRLAAKAVDRVEDSDE